MSGRESEKFGLLFLFLIYFIAGGGCDDEDSLISLQFFVRFWILSGFKNCCQFLAWKSQVYHLRKKKSFQQKNLLHSLHFGFYANIPATIFPFTCIRHQARRLFVVFKTLSLP
jgi:hypothetical protein